MTNSQDVAKLLHSAGLAVQALRKVSRTAPADDSTLSSTIEQQKQNFNQAASQYFSLLSSIDVRLRRQIYALEEAEIIPADVPLKEKQINLTVPSAFAALVNVPVASSVKHTASSKIAGGGGGLGTLDVGWLNSRNDDVGKE